MHPRPCSINQKILLIRRPLRVLPEMRVRRKAPLRSQLLPPPRTASEYSVPEPQPRTRARLHGLLWIRPASVPLATRVFRLPADATLVAGIAQKFKQLRIVDRRAIHERQNDTAAYTANSFAAFHLCEISGCCCPRAPLRIPGQAHMPCLPHRADRLPPAQ